MKAYRVSNPCVPAALHQALAALGVPVLTVRAGWADSKDAAALFAVIVTDDSADDAVVNDFILSYALPLVTPLPSRSMTAPEKENSLAQMEKL